MSEFQSEEDREYYLEKDPAHLEFVSSLQGIIENVKVLDFGLAKQAEVPHGTAPQTRAEFVMGTAEYMAPEQACGLPVSPRTDLYAVGVILFEMLTGQRPFMGEAPAEVAYQHVNTPPPLPSALVGGLSPQLEELVLRLLAKKPEQRPSSAAQVLGEIEAMARGASAGSALARGEPTPVAVARAAPTARRGWFSEPRVQISLGVVCALAAILLGVVLAALFKHSPDAAAPFLPPSRARVRLAPATSNPYATRASSEGYQGQLPHRLEPVSTEPAVPEEPPRVDTAQTPPAGVGRLQIVSTCWAYVYIDGTMRGRVPMPALAVSVGSHTVELKRNPQVEDYRVQVVVPASGDVRVNAPCIPVGG